jgi:hypothetical protein
VIPTGVAVGDGVGVQESHGVGVGVHESHGVGVGVQESHGVGDGVGLTGGVGVGDIVAVGVGVGVGVPPVQVPLTLNTMCMFGNPIVDTSVGVVIPQSTALI